MKYKYVYVLPLKPFSERNNLLNMGLVMGAEWSYINAVYVHRYEHKNCVVQLYRRDWLRCVRQANEGNVQEFPIASHDYLHDIEFTFRGLRQSVPCFLITLKKD